MPNQLTKKFGYFGVGDSSAAGMQANPSGAAGKAAIVPRHPMTSAGVYAPAVDPNASAFSLGGGHPNPAHRTNRPAGMGSADWNRQVSSTLPGGSASGGMFGGPGSYQSGITNGTVGSQTINDAMRNFGMGQAPGVPMSGAGAGAVSQQYGDLMNQGLGTAGIDFARNAAFQQSQMDNAQQRARSDSGIGFGNLLARLYEMQLSGQNAEQGMAQNLLMGLVG